MIIIITIFIIIIIIIMIIIIMMIVVIIITIIIIEIIIVTWFWNASTRSVCFIRQNTAVQSRPYENTMQQVLWLEHGSVTSCPFMTDGPTDQPTDLPTDGQEGS